MKSIKFIAALLALLLCMSACSRPVKNENPTESPSSALRNTISQPEAPSGPSTIVWEADLTRDGENEKIVVDIDIFLQNSSSEAATVTVYSQKNGQDSVLWQGDAGLAHVGWNSFHLYTDEEGQPYILNWYPYTNMGQWMDSYEIFSLSEQGEKIIRDSDAFEPPASAFNLEQDSVDLSNVRSSQGKTYEEYESAVTKYMSQSFVLLDTLGGKTENSYSTPDKKISSIAQYE